MEDTKQHKYYCCSHTGRIKQSIREGHTLLRNALHVHNNLSDKGMGTCHHHYCLITPPAIFPVRAPYHYDSNYCSFLLTTIQYTCTCTNTCTASSSYHFPVTPYQYTCKNTASFSYSTFQFHYALLHVTIHVPPQVDMYNSHHNQLCAR